MEADRSAHTTRSPADAGVLGPAGSSRALAIVHLAMHDAYLGINPGFDCYLGASLPPVPAGADAAAAVAAAVHATLSALYPAQKATFDARHLAAGLIASRSTSDGHSFGQKVAARVLALRESDPALGDDGYAPSPTPGHHRPDPDNPSQGFYGPFYGSRSHCFAVTTRYHLDPPPAPGSLEYARAFRQVRGLGVAPQLAGTLPAGLPTRRPAETTVGLFWGYDGAAGIGTPPRLYNQVIRQVVAVQGNGVTANARLFALVHAAMADAAILAWADKYTYDMWRPVVGIREHSSLGLVARGEDGLDPDADPGWLPLGASKTNRPGQRNFTPPFPTYPSGHATFGAASLQTVRQFYRQGSPGPDNLADGLEIVSDEFDGISTDNEGRVRPRVPRRFPGGLWEMIEENGRSRVFLGVHWMFDAFAVDDAGEMDLRQNIGGVRLGLDIANDISAHGLRAAAAAGPAAH